MMKRNGTIDLAVIRETPYFAANGGTMAIQLYSADLSGDTTYNLNVSLDADNWDVAQEGSEDITGTLASGAANVLQLEMVAGIYYKVGFDGATTGEVDYIILD